MKSISPKLLLKFHKLRFLLVIGGALTFWTGCATFQPESGFISLFDGQSLKGWTFVGEGPGCFAKNGVIVNPKDCTGNLFTEKEYSDFVLRLDYKLEPGGNNGVGIRAPL